MGGGAQPATWLGFLHRWGVVLAAAAMTVVGIARVDVQAAPASKRTDTAATPKTAPASAPAPAQTQTTAQPRKPAKVAHRPKRERTSDRASTDLGERLNKNTLVIISGGLQSTDLAITHQLSDALGDGDDLRIVPMVGAGGSRNIRDVRFMKGIDLGITQTNLLTRLRQSGEIGPLDDKIVYLAKLFNEELHIVVRADSGLASLDDLKGRTVSLGEPGSGTQLIAHDVLDRLGIAVREVNMDGADAIERLDTGEIDAVALIGGKPIPAVAQRSGLRLIAVPFAKPLRDDLLPAALESEDYPGAIEPGSRVDTVAVGTVLIAYNWAKDSDQYKKIRKFVGAFFPQIAKLQAPPHHPKWREVNLAATLPGWPRFAAAETWLAQHKGNAPVEGARTKFDEFVRARGGETGSAEDHEKLFQEFLQWSEARARR
jgi:TRAP transporter TAXI family solute receptor